jgi:hypothetical protein
MHNPYGDWRNAVDERLHQIYCITIADAGLDEEYLIDQWLSNEAPFDFVEWIGNKFDLFVCGTMSVDRYPLKTSSR